MNEYETENNLNQEIYQDNNEIKCNQWIEYNSFIEENGSISALNFHDSTELLWVGNHTGRITSYLHTSESEIIKYSSFVGHYNPVLQLFPISNHIVSISSDQIKMNTLGGLSVATLKPIIVDYNNDIKELTCGTLFEPSGGLYRPGAQNYLFLGSSGNLSYTYDINTISNDPIITFDVTSPSNCVQSSITYLTVGSSDGKIRLLDPSLRSNSVEHILDGHSGGVSHLSFQTDGMTLISCGYQSRVINPYNQNSSYAVIFFLLKLTFIFSNYYLFS